MNNNCMCNNNQVTDFGPQPYVANIDELTIQNQFFRRALWTGNHLQVTLMSIKPGESIGLEVHPNVDQFLKVVQGLGLVQMGDSRQRPNFEKRVKAGYSVMIPAGKWHNLTNIGRVPIKLYSVYAPPQHSRGTIDKTKAEVEE